MSQPTASNSDALEAHFDLAELFFSRTDDRGVIQAGNSVFQRVSCYAWDDLLNAPHKIIRHAQGCVLLAMGDDQIRQTHWRLCQKS